MPNYEEIIQQSQANIKSLSDKLKSFDKLHQDIKKLIKQPEIFDAKYQQIVKLSEEYTNILGATTKKYLDCNNTLFTTNLNELSNKTTNLQKEILRLVNTDFTKLFRELQKSFIDQTSIDLAIELNKIDDKSTDLQTKINELRKQIERLVNTDFTKLFQDLQKSFIDQASKDLAIELKKFDDKSTDLQTKINELKTQVERLVNTDITKLFQDLQKSFIDQATKNLAIELNKFDDKSTDLQTKIDELRKQVERLDKIDLERHFDKLQKILAEIFGAINAINLTLTNVVQTLTGIVQTLGNIQTTLDINHKEIKQLLNNFGETTEKYLTEIDKQATKNVELLEGKIEVLSGESESLKREVKTNRMIQIVGFVIVVSMLIYLIVR